MDSLLRRYEIMSVLGEAKSGVLYLAKHKESGIQRVVKHVVLDESNYSNTMNELECFRLLRDNPHPYAVDCITYYHSLPDLFFVYEYLPGGTLLDVLRSRSRDEIDNDHSISTETFENNVLSEVLIKDIIRGIISATNHLHRLQICHRDLKLENICLSQGGIFKIIDFDLACRWSPSASLTTYCGSVHYSAPELFLRLPYFGPEVDAWSTGVILFALLFRRFPFEFHEVSPLDVHLDQYERDRVVAHQAVHGVFICDPQIRMSYECHDFLHRLLTVDMNKRMSIQEALNHPWLSRCENKPLNEAQTEHLQEYLVSDVGQEKRRKITEKKRQKKVQQEDTQEQSHQSRRKEKTTNLSNQYERLKNIIAVWRAVKGK